MGFIRRLTICLLAGFALQGCDTGPDASSSSHRTLAEIQTAGELVVLTRNAPTTWYIGRDGEPTGPEYDMVTAFAATLGVTPTFKTYPTVEAILDALEAGEGDMAAAGLTITEDRQARFRFGPAYQDVTQQVVCRRDNVQPESVEALVGLNIAVIAASSYVEKLQELQAEHPALAWSETSEKDTEQLLQDVWERKLDCTVADSNIVDINRRFYPELIAPFNLSRAQSLGWVLPAGAKALDKAANEWHATFEESGRLASLHERYYGFFEVFDYVDTRVLIRRIDARFPKYDDYFRQAAKEYDIPYLLLAAQGYQESHWNERAKSPTGVRGIMMLTQRTAKAMGVTNRLDPKQSIFGGAKYLARMRERFVDEVKEPDRTWLALAAYNIGRAHMHDAQILAREMDLSPHLWRDVKQVLPLLAQKRYYSKLKYGYARGTEPVRYVQRIREYQHVLENEMLRREQSGP